jgi:hypothetical protein
LHRAGNPAPRIAGSVQERHGSALVRPEELPGLIR